MVDRLGLQPVSARPVVRRRGTGTGEAKGAKVGWLVQKKTHTTRGKKEGSGESERWFFLARRQREADVSMSADG